jgi:hypothetical protein
MKQFISAVPFALWITLLWAGPAIAQYRYDPWESIRKSPSEYEIPAFPTDLNIERSTLSSATVAGVAALGALAGAAAFGLGTIMNDQSVTPMLLPSLAAGGAAVGGMTGALVGGRRIAPVFTLFGAGLGALPLFPVQNVDRELEWLNFPAVFLPAFGAWLGNTIGQ